MAVRPFRLPLLFALLALGCSRAPPAGEVPAPDTETTTAALDRSLEALWKERGAHPAPHAAREAWLRRVTLDLTGRLPSPDALDALLADTAAGAEARVVDRLLASPAHADRWAGYWEDVLLGTKLRDPNGVDRGAFRRWLHAQFETNRPWNEVVYGLVSASGRNSLGGLEARDDSLPPSDVVTLEAAAGVNGAVNWALRYRDQTADLAGATSRTFLGRQIQCAQCHDHRTEAWKQADFQRFAASFTHLKADLLDKGPDVKGLKRFDLSDKPRPLQPNKKAPPEAAAYLLQMPTALDGTRLDTVSPRRDLADWMAHPGQPWLAEAFVNRMWGELMGRGFVEPVDDLRPSNPATAPQTLALLATDFREHGFDVKRLLRVLVLSRAYGAESVPLGRDVPGDESWAHQRLRPLGANALFTAIAQATRAGSGGDPGSENALALAPRRQRRELAFVFDVDEESHEDDFQGTLPQALLLMNGPAVQRAVRSQPSSTVQAAEALDDRAAVNLLCREALSRKPTEAELVAWGGLLSGAVATEPPAKRNAARRAALEDLMWALLNSSEFFFNH